MKKCEAAIVEVILPRKFDYQRSRNCRKEGMTRLSLVNLVIEPSHNQNFKLHMGYNSFHMGCLQNSSHIPKTAFFDQQIFPSSRYGDKSCIQTRPLEKPTLHDPVFSTNAQRASYASEHEPNSSNA